MATLLDRIRTRLIPAVLTACGVTLVAAGLLNYTTPVDAGPTTPAPTPVTVTASPSSSPRAATPSPVISPSFGPVIPEPAPTFPADRVATRVTVPALRVDLPVIRPPGGRNTYPACDVAMYIQELGQPGQGKAIYIYAHAQKNMFLPILDASKIENGKRMLGMIVEVYTSDDQLFLYEIVEVRRHQISLDDALSATDEVLWLQTSEGPRGTVGKTQVIATLLSSGPADPAEAHPSARPRACG
jgi:hypothetical protein